MFVKMYFLACANVKKSDPIRAIFSLFIYTILWFRSRLLSANIHHLHRSSVNTHPIFVLQHERYGMGQGFSANDVALLKLSRQVNPDYIIPRATSGDFSGETCTISGWGVTEGKSACRL